MGACASQSPKSYVDYQNMGWEQINAEIVKLNNVVAQSKTNKEIGRVVDTGTTVAATGASMAGIPYVGGVFSIGKTHEPPQTNHGE